tara:strand:+ start:12494 stop:14389 length:1896 start_codon:yes stop_codon:yes gene_type:complete
MDLYRQFISLSRYARWKDDDLRRETWDETVTRFMSFMRKHLSENTSYKLEDNLAEELYEAIFNHDVMPSMRLLMTAGEPVELDNICAYNCSYLAINRPQAFDEVLYILMNGTGVGYSVEKEDVDQLPAVPPYIEDVDTTIVVGDSKLGWAKAFRQLLESLWKGENPSIDYSKIRPMGSRLMTFGGRASGPEPLKKLFNFTVETFVSAEGRQLKPIEVHDIVCKIGSCVEVGGVRRSALISLSDLNDADLRVAKTGEWWRDKSFRSQANNSAVYEGKPSMGQFMEEWVSLYNSKSGERGIFNRDACRTVITKNGRRSPHHKFGTNPCSEIILRDMEFCNLTEVVIREDDKTDALANKVRLATILGTFQASLTNFRHINPTFEKNCREEALLGVSLTGIMDNRLTASADPELLSSLKKVAITTNEKYADKLGINRSKAITCVKPSGTVSQLVDSASGIHPRHSEYYIRRVRGDIKDPMTKYMMAHGFPHEKCNYQPENVVVFSFPQAAPTSSVMREELSAIDHLKIWKRYQLYWCEHKPSITISIKDDEWMEVGQFVWENFDLMSGISFLPYSEHTYEQAPYEEIDEDSYSNMVHSLPTLDSWDGLKAWELEDNTKGAQTAACVAGQCEIVDI